MDSICNLSSAWGLVSNQAVIKLGGILLLLLILYMGYNAKSKLVRFGWFLIFFGGASNLFERFSKGCVSDYWKPFNWYPAFNVFDVMIVGGVILITIEQFRRKRVDK